MAGNVLPGVPQSGLKSVSTLLITGGNSLVGAYLQATMGSQYSGVLVGRSRPVKITPGFEWRHFDLARDDLDSMNAEAAIHLAPLPLLPRHISTLSALGVKRLVTVGTTSRFTKAESPSSLDQRMVEDQARAETELARLCKQHGIAWTLLRPTMVYDGRSDKNVAIIVRIIKRWGCFPVIGDAHGLRQPLHAQDLASACLAVLENRGTHDKAYNLAGGEQLTYRAMVERIFLVLGKRVRIIRVPLWMFRAGLRCAAVHPRYRYLTFAMASRMNQDMVFDITDARRDFGFSPRTFLPDFKKP